MLLGRELIKVNALCQLDCRFDCRRHLAALGVRRCEQPLKARQSVWRSCLHCVGLTLLLVRRLWVRNSSWSIRSSHVRRAKKKFDIFRPVRPVRVCVVGNCRYSGVDIFQDLGAPVARLGVTRLGVSHSGRRHRENNRTKQDEGFHSRASQTAAGPAKQRCVYLGSQDNSNHNQMQRCPRFFLNAELTN